MDENEKRPNSMSQDEEEQVLGKWLVTQMNYWTMKDTKMIRKNLRIL